MPAPTDPDVEAMEVIARRQYQELVERFGKDIAVKTLALIGSFAQFAIAIKDPDWVTIVLRMLGEVDAEARITRKKP